jgi:hypothetical protein
MGSIEKDLLLPGTPTKTIRLDNNPSTLDTNVYNMNNINRLLTQINWMLPAYTTRLKEYYYLFDLNKKYDDENEDYNTNTKKEYTDLLKNERKTFYQDQGIDSLDNYYYWLRAVYILTVVVLMISFFIFPSDWSAMKRLLAFVFLILLPFCSTYIMTVIIRLLYAAYNLLPKNTYLDK